MQVDGMFPLSGKLCQGPSTPELQYRFNTTIYMGDVYCSNTESVVSRTNTCIYVYQISMCTPLVLSDFKEVLHACNLGHD